MSNKNIEVPVTIEVICPICNKPVGHNFTEQDLLDRDELEFQCECGYKETVKTKTIIDNAMNAVQKEFEKAFKKR